MNRMRAALVAPSPQPFSRWHGADRPLVWRGGSFVRWRDFLEDVAAVGSALPDQAYVINLCEDRYLFLVAFVAAVLRGQANLLPPSRAPRVIEQVAARYAGAYTLTDRDVDTTAGAAGHMRDMTTRAIDPDVVAAIVFTSGSTGDARPNAKRWGDLVRGADMLSQTLRLTEKPGATVVATVPPQHMYGLETTVMLPLVSGVRVHGGRPFFPEDVRRAVTEVPAPRILVSTPLHLRSCAQSGLQWPGIAAVVSATAPLSATVASEAEKVFNAAVTEIFGCTEGGALASRRTVQGEVWRVHEEMRLETRQDGVYVSGPQLPAPVMLNDIVDVVSEQTFKLLGRDSDMINVAGKRASLGDLNHKLTSLPGVEDGVFLLRRDGCDEAPRLCALVVAPRLSEMQIISALADYLDPVFLPRPLYKVDALPRNETGKLPREAAEALLQRLRKDL